MQAQISAAEAKNFGKVWTHKGIVIFMDDTHYQFAADFANIVLRNFIQQAQAQAVEAAKQKQIVIAQD
jgi:hypothetical protein